jgi:hypothetical protein
MIYLDVNNKINIEKNKEGGVWFFPNVAEKNILILVEKKIII